MYNISLGWRKLFVRIVRGGQEVLFLPRRGIYPTKSVLKITSCILEHLALKSLNFSGKQTKYEIKFCSIVNFGKKSTKLGYERRNATKSHQSKEKKVQAHSADFVFSVLVKTEILSIFSGSFEF